MNIVISAKNTEDVYMGVEWEQGTAECAKLIEFLNKNVESGKETDSPRFRRRHQAHFHHRHQAPGAHGPSSTLSTTSSSVTLVHKRQHPEFTEARSASGDTISPPPSSATKSSRARELDHRHKDKNPNLTSRKNAELVAGMELRHPNFARPWKKK